MNNIKEQVGKILGKVKEFWSKLSPKIKKLLIFGGVLLLTAIVISVFLSQANANKMKVLFPELSATETSQVYSLLEEMGVPAEINSKGEILVPESQWGETQLQLAGQGYPKSAPTYDTFLNNSGFTRTESEKRQIQIYQTQDLIQGALSQAEGIEMATVILSLPEDSDYVWDTNKQQSSASVTITTKPGYELSEERVLAIKNLVAFSVLPQIDPNNVKVIDAKTGIEMLPDESSLTEMGINAKRLEFESKVKKNIEDNIRRLLAPMYGADGVTAVAWVTLDYDKMLTEQHQLVPEEDGNGVKTHFDEQYTVDGNVPVSGIAGEENNTDVPTYPNQDGEGDNGLTDYNRSIDWDISYINTQIEKGQAIIKEASVAVIVKDNNFTEQRRADLLDLISKSVNISEDSISIQNYQVTEDQPAISGGFELTRNMLLILIGAGALLLLLLILFIILMVQRSNKKKRAQEEAESENKIRDLQAEIEQHKRELLENAQANSNNKEIAITNEIRDFARENPEITASLIRSMLKEDEG